LKLEMILAFAVKCIGGGLKGLAVA
jgi:hypothetical protein